MSFELVYKGDSTLSLNNKFKNKKFLKNMVESASPGQLIVLLYEGCLQWLQMAKLEVKKNTDAEIPNWSSYSQYMNKAHDIVTHLQESLREDQSKEISDRLFALYDFVKGKIAHANAYKNLQDIDDASVVMKDLKDTWKEVLKKDTLAV